MINYKLSFEEQRDVAQSGSATVWGTGGRKFESCHPDKKYETSRAFCSACFVSNVLISLRSNDLLSCANLVIPTRYTKQQSSDSDIFVELVFN